jgi:hypothetical protein
MARLEDIDIEEMLDLFSLDELCEMGDLTREEALEILVRFGGLSLPDFLDKSDNSMQYSEDT